MRVGRRGTAALACTVALLNHCGEPVVIATVSSVQVLPASDTLIFAGATLQFAAVAHDADGHVVPDKIFSWQSSEPTVATVEPSGLVTARGDGQTTIRASVDGVNGTATLHVTIAALLVFTVQPVTTIAGEALTPAVQVEVRDAHGQRVVAARDTVRLVLTFPGSATLSGVTKLQLAGGAATFTGLSVDKAGANYTLTALSDPLAATSDVFDITPAAPHHLSFVTEPSVTQTAQVIAPAVQVAIQDTFGNTVAVNAPITVSIGSNVGGGTLSGTGTVTALNGIASFASLRIDRRGSGYTLAATSGSLQAAASAPFDVVTFQSVSAGVYHTCGLAVGGSVYCWGSNFFGQLGGGTEIAYTSPVLVSGGLTFASVDAGHSHTCGITSSGELYCWGLNLYGQLGDGTTIQRSLPVRIESGIRFSRVSTGYYHTCGVTLTGITQCWGANDSSQLGDGTTLQRASPVAVSGGHTFVEISAGGSHSCGVTADGEAYCWGGGGFGQVGDGGTLDRVSPVLVSGGLAFTSLETGDQHSCGIANSTAYCWGFNGGGEVGAGNLNYYSSPESVLVTVQLSAVTAAGLHSCGVALSGSGYCWGADLSGELGDGMMDTQSHMPTLVVGGLSFVNLTAGGFHTCGITTDGLAYCWGYNIDGEVGDGSTSDRAVPVLVR